MYELQETRNATQLEEYMFTVCCWQSASSYEEGRARAAFVSLVPMEMAVSVHCVKAAQSEETN